MNIKLGTFTLLSMSSDDGFGKQSTKFYATLAELVAIKHNKYYY